MVTSCYCDLVWRLIWFWPCLNCCRYSSFILFSTGNNGHKLWNFAKKELIFTSYAQPSICSFSLSWLVSSILSPFFNFFFSRFLLPFFEVKTNRNLCVNSRMFKQKYGMSVPCKHILWVFDCKNETSDNFNIVLDVPQMFPRSFSRGVLRTLLNI